MGLSYWVRIRVIRGEVILFERRMCTFKSLGLGFIFIFV